MKAIVQGKELNTICINNKQYVVYRGKKRLIRSIEESCYNFKTKIIKFNNVLIEVILK